VTGEVQRTRGWLDGDRRRHWDMEVKRAERQVEQAEAELYSASLSSVKTSDSFRKMAVLKARRRLAETVEKRRQVKRWRNIFDQRTDPLLRQVESLQDKVARDLPDAVVSLNESIRALEEYAGTRAPSRRRPAAAVDDPAATDGDEPQEEEAP